MQDKFIIIGLGNPGKKYEHSPHNAGFAVIDTLVAGIKNKELGMRKREEKLAEIWKGTLEGMPVILAKPKIFMNESGLAVQALTKSYTFTRRSVGEGGLKAKSSALWLIHDDIDLPLGALRIVQNRGSAGHKGAQSVIDARGTKNFVRFRIGIRPQGMPHRRSKTLMNRFVVGRYTPQEQGAFETALIRCAEAVRFAVQSGIEKAMTVYNR